MEFILTNHSDYESPIIVKGSSVKLSDDSNLPSEFLSKKGNITIQAHGKNKKTEVLIGLGDKNTSSKVDLTGYMAKAAKMLQEREIKSVAVDIDSFISKSIKVVQVIEAVVYGFILGSAKPGRCKSEEKTNDVSEKVELLIKKEIEELKRITADLEIIAEYINRVRHLANLPANIADAQYIKNEIQNIIEERKIEGIELEIHDVADLKRQKLNLILAVSAGTESEPLMLELKYRPRLVNISSDSLFMIGKGIIFDSGGLDLKNAQQLRDSRDDMTGGVTALMAVLAAAELKLPLGITAIVPLVENLPCGNPMKPGDVYTSFKGITVEVANTDAEGRLILADAMAYAEAIGAEHIISIATLTGSAKYTLGEEIAPYLSESDKLVSLLEKASENTDEPLWRMPLWDGYKDNIKSDIADISNLGKFGAGVITAALFLNRFIDKADYAHIDIAAVATPEKRNPVTGKGPTGFGLKLLVEIARLMSKS
ncbi:MAG: leucyl aminopeptidase family protein [Acidobacteria bacterium]|nr:leucyl aminopeptidase family protein [Acidobacteriota bacterium]